MGEFFKLIIIITLLRFKSLCRLSDYRVKNLVPIHGGSPETTRIITALSYCRVKGGPQLCTHYAGRRQSP